MSKNCVLADMTAANNPPTRLYVPLVTFSKENDKNFLEQLISGYKRTVKWNIYRAQMTFHPQNNNLNYLIDPTFIGVLTDYLFCHLKELKKTMLKKIIEILFHTIM